MGRVQPYHDHQVGHKGVMQQRSLQQQQHGVTCHVFNRETTDGERGCFGFIPYRMGHVTAVGFVHITDIAVTRDTSAAPATVPYVNSKLTGLHRIVQ